MTFLGGDTDAMRALAQTMARRSTALREAMSRIGSQAVSVEWHGTDGDDFRAAVRVAVSRSAAMTDRLEALGTELEAQADDQDRTSHESGVSGGGGEGRAHDVGMVQDPGDERGTEPADEDIPEDDESLDPMNSGQGQIGDCYLIASLQALAEQDPDFVREHVNEVEPGVYEVTLYDDDGHPVVYRVTSVQDVGVRGKDGDQSLYSLYERAYKLHLDERGEGDLNGGLPKNAMRTITGHDADGYAPADRLSLHDLANQLDRGNLVTADTGGIDDPSHDQIVGGHAYTVTSVDEDAGTVTVTNPWREGDPDYPKTVTMTYDEYRETFRTTSIGRTEEKSLLEKIGIGDGIGWL